MVIENITSEILHRMIEDLPQEKNQKLKDSLYIVLNKYNISEKSTDLITIDESWRGDLQRFLDRKRISGKSESTIERYGYILQKVFSYINKPINEITQGDLNDFIEKYKQYRGVSNSTLEGVRKCMSSFFTFQHERGFISKNPCKGVDPIKCPKILKKAFTDEEMEKIKINCKNLRDLALVQFLYSTGVRVSELCALNVDDIGADGEIIINGKGSKQRTVYLTPVSNMYLNIYLEQRKDRNIALFVSNRKPHKRLNPGGVRAALKKIGTRAGVENVHPHRYRTTLATNLIKKGMPIEEVKIILGHQKIDTTLLYSLVDKDKVKSDISRLMTA